MRTGANDKEYWLLTPHQVYEQIYAYLKRRENSHVFLSQMVTHLLQPHAKQSIKRTDLMMTMNEKAREENPQEKRRRVKEDLQQAFEDDD